MSTKATIKVIYWGGSEEEFQIMDIDLTALDTYFSAEQPFIVGRYNNRIVAVKTEQIISIEEEIKW